MVYVAKDQILSEEQVFSSHHKNDDSKKKDANAKGYFYRAKSKEAKPAEP